MCECVCVYVCVGGDGLGMRLAEKIVTVSCWINNKLSSHMAGHNYFQITVSPQETHATVMAEAIYVEVGLF